MQDLQMLQDVARRRRWRNVVARTRHHRARLLKYYPRPPCAPSFVKSRMLRPLQTHFLLFQQIFFVLVCIHPGTPRVPPRVLASGPKPCGGKNNTYLVYLLSKMELWSDESQAASNLNTQLFSSGWDWTWGESTFKEMVWGELSPAGGGTRAVRTRPTRKQISISWVTWQEPIPPYFTNIFFDSRTTLEGWALGLCTVCGNPRLPQTSNCGLRLHVCRFAVRT